MKMKKMLKKNVGNIIWKKICHKSNSKRKIKIFNIFQSLFCEKDI